ncbi:MAG TPA: hypothetical protein PKD61_02345 [Polyangiaceae bacterium]|nr:hypothetical protein [Polyangiaceae bacterium]
MSRQLTIRNVPPEVAAALKKLSQERNESVNATVVQILKQALGIDERRTRLQRYTTWTADEAQAFDAALAEQRRVDERDWS